MDPHDNDYSEDPALDEDERNLVARLSDAEIEDIDQAILANCRPTWTKVATVVSAAMDYYPNRFLEVPDIYYSERVRNLVTAGRLQAQGNLKRMRYSEIQLAESLNC